MLCQLSYMGSFPIKVTKRDEKFAINRSLRSDFGVMTVIFFYFLRLNSSVESKSRTPKVKNFLKIFCTISIYPANPLLFRLLAGLPPFRFRRFRQS